MELDPLDWSFGAAISDGWDETYMVGSYIVENPGDAIAAAWSTVESGESYDCASGLVYRMFSFATEYLSFGFLHLPGPENIQPLFGNRDAFLTGYHNIGNVWQAATSIVLLRDAICQLPRLMTRAPGLPSLAAGNGAFALAAELNVALNGAATARAFWNGIGGLNGFANAISRMQNQGGAGANGNPRTGPTSAEIIAEEMGPGHFHEHGDPSTWRYLGSRTVPATEAGRAAGTKKVHEVFLDESGRQIEWHYWLNPNGTVDGGKIVFPGTSGLRGLVK